MNIVRPITTPASTPAVEITVLKAAEGLAPAAFAYGLRHAFGKGVRMGLLAFVLRHPEHAPIVIDTGLHHDALRGVQHDFGRVSGLALRPIRPAGIAFDQQLREAGVDPEQLETVVMTHLHVDHTSGMRLLPRARFLTQRAEWEAARAPRAELAGYLAHHLPDASRVELLEIPEAGEHDLFGDGSIVLLATPGHTHGHLAVQVNGERGPVLIAGDAVYTQRNLDEDILPLLSADRAAQRRSMQLIRRWLAENPGGLLVPTHDPEAWRRL